MGTNLTGNYNPPGALGSGQNSVNDADEEEINTERREKRIQRENLLRNYSGRKESIELDLKERKKERDDLENKIRFQEGSVAEGEEKITELTGKLERAGKKLKRDRFELRQSKSRIMEVDKEVVNLEQELTGVERKLKKIRIEGSE